MKDQRDHGIAFHLTDLLRHGTANKLRLITMIDEHAKRSNHIIDSIYRLINKIDDIEGGIPPHLFFQLDNWSGENNKRLFVAFLECLIAGKVIQTVKVGFPPIEHAHLDIE